MGRSGAASSRSRARSASQSGPAGPVRGGHRPALLVGPQQFQHREPVADSRVLAVAEDRADLVSRTAPPPLARRVHPPGAVHPQMAVEGQPALDPGQQVFPARDDVQDGTAGEVGGGEAGDAQVRPGQLPPASAVWSRAAVCRTVSPSGMTPSWARRARPCADPPRDMSGGSGSEAAPGGHGPGRDPPDVPGGLPRDVVPVRRAAADPSGWRGIRRPPGCGPAARSGRRRRSSARRSPCPGPRRARRRPAPRPPRAGR